MRKAQIAIDYIGGASIFFLSILFVVLSVLNGIPEYSAGATTNTLELTGWSVTSTLLNMPGFWQQGDNAGTDWESQVKAGSIDAIESIGLTDQRGLRLSKIRALTAMEYQELKAILGLDADFQLSVTAFPIVRLTGRFSKGGAPSNHPPLSLPSDTSYQNADPVIRYGAVLINSTRLYALATAHNGTYDTIYIGDDWNFDVSERVEAGDQAVVTAGDRRLVLEPIEAGLAGSRGRHFVLEWVVGRVGQRVPATADQSITVNRFKTINQTPARLAMEVWE